MAQQVVVLNNLVVVYNDTNYTATFDNNVGGTQPAEIIKKSNNKATIRFYDNQVVQILQDIDAIAGLNSANIKSVGNMTQITLP